MPVTDGISLGPYRILRELGAGGMGQVYLADDKRLGRQVALKQLTGRWLESPNARRRLLREARAAGQLNHPNIATVYDVLEHLHDTYIVMEYVEGRPLAERIQEGSLPLPEALALAIELADALAAAHARGVVHCDLKPANVRLTSEGRAKVLDFGLAQILATDTTAQGVLDNSTEEATATHQLIGTPGYMAPERLLGKPVDHRCDIYSLGVLLYEVLTGRRPFSGSDFMAIGLSVLTDKPLAPSEHNPALPAELDAVVQRAIAPDPDARYQSAAALKAELVQIATMLSEGRTGRVVGAGALIERWIGRVQSVSRARLIAVLATVALVIASMIPARYLLSRGDTADDPAPAVAVLPLENLTGDPADDGLSAGISEVLRSNLSKVRGLNVLSRSATLSANRRHRDPARIARELGATLLIDGGVHRAGDRVTVTITVVRAGSNLVHWSENYSSDGGSIFELQGLVSQGVVRQLPLALSADDRRQLARAPTADQDAFAEFAQGRAFLERPDVPDNIERAIRLFERAISRDSGFALAHAGLGEAYWTQYEVTRDPALPDKAMRAIEDAVRLDPGQPLVKTSLAMIYAGTGRNAEAVDELRRALEIQPQLDEAYRLMGDSLTSLGRREEARDAFRRAIELRPHYWRHYSFLGRSHFDAGEFAEAEAAYRRITELQPDNAWGFQMLGAVYQSLGDNARALEHYQQANQLEPNRFAWSNIGTIHYTQVAFLKRSRPTVRPWRLRHAWPGSTGIWGMATIDSA